MQDIRVRFAPSPTGNLHIGGLRVAIFNWLFAKHNKGKFLLRIEDTDLERSKPEYTDAILQGLEWMSILADEPITIQSKRIDEHKKLISKLIAQDKAYVCFCTARPADELENEESYSKYDRACREKNPTLQDLEKPFVVRFKVPYENNEIISFDDLIHKTITFDIKQFDDFIIARSDGTPTYNFVVVADDIHMKISHIIRGEDHISNTPKQILLYRALGVEPPLFAHVPLILNSAGAKLSKRDAAVSVIEYKKEGFLPEALFNYLVRLGWSHGDQEIFTKDELIKYFSLDHVGKSGAIFDIKKLEWVNATYMRQKTSKDLCEIIIKDIDPAFLIKSGLSQKQIFDLIDLYKERAKTLKILSQQIISLNQVNNNEYEMSGLKDLVAADMINYLQELINQLETVDDSNWQADNLSIIIKTLCTKLQIKFPQMAQPTRLALTGTLSSPGIFELLFILSKEESIRRLKNFITFLNLT